MEQFCSGDGWKFNKKGGKGVVVRNVLVIKYLHRYKPFFNAGMD